MNRESISTQAKRAVIVLGALCTLLACATLPAHALSWHFLLVLAFATVVTPRMTLVLPRTRFAISFSDAVVFLVFLYYGGSAAILVAAIETLASCIYLNSRGFQWGRLMIPTNIALNAVATAATYATWLGLTAAGVLSLDLTHTPQLIGTIGAIGLAQFVYSSVLAAVFQSLADGSNVFETWKRDCFSSSMTQIVGAGIAAVLYKVIHYADLRVALFTLGALLMAYFGYRQSITKIGAAIKEAEEAERQKAETERSRRLEAERHFAELTASLEKEARANDALRRSEIDLQHAALYDSLTDLPNRKHFGNVLRGMIEEYKHRPSEAFQVLFLDIRKFKNINDSLGHSLGDKVLMIAAKRFVRMLNSSDLVARIGGDEFAVVLKGLSSAAKAQKVARRIIDSISQPFSLSGNRVSIGVNIGIAPCDAEYETPEEVLRDADIAMHYAKEKDLGVAIFTKELRVKFLERIRFENDLRHAIDRDEFSLHYQPLVCLQDGSLLGFEALLRWNHSEAGPIPPNKFIPIAEESGLIMPITTWILRQTALQLSEWQKIRPDFSELIVSVNISGKHLSNDDLIDDVENALAVSKISPSSLKLEITESAAMENAEHTINILNRLKQIGVQLSIDDFGTGYSSLSYLHRLPFDTLKIDRSFVYSVDEKGENSEILQTIISLAKSLKKKVVAEGIETEAQLALLQNLGCDYGQGYLLARPQTREKAEKLLYERGNWLPARTADEFDQGTVQSTGDHLPVF